MACHLGYVGAVIDRVANAIFFFVLWLTFWYSFFIRNCFFRVVDVFFFNVWWLHSLFLKCLHNNGNAEQPKKITWKRKWNGKEEKQKRKKCKKKKRNNHQQQQHSSHYKNGGHSYMVSICIKTSDYEWINMFAEEEEEKKTTTN